MAGFLTDLRSAIRQFSRDRGLTLVALTSLAVGIGVSAAITSVSTAVLVRPLPYDKPEELVMVWARGSGPSSLTGFGDPRGLVRLTVTAGMLLQWNERELPFTDFAVLESWQTGSSARVDLIDGSGVERLRGTFATANLFDVLGVRPALGRTFAPDETGVALVSARLWRRRFGADPDVLGRTITLATGRERERERIQIIGVLPERFRFDYPDETEIWLPLTWAAIDGTPHVAVSFRAVARLRPDTSIQAAEAAMQLFRDPAQRDAPMQERLWLEPVHDYVVGASRAPLLLVSLLTLLVLLSGAVNAATVFAASAASRLRDLRVRRALGASHARLVRQAFTQAGAIAALAGGIGMMTLSLAIPTIRALLPADLPRVDEIRLDGVTLAGVCAAAVISTLVAGFAPAWFALRDSDRRRLEAGHTVTLSGTGLRLRTALLGVQVAVVTALLITGGMLARSFWNIVHVDKGFAVQDDVYVAEIQLRHPAYRNKRFNIYESELLRRVRALPYVDAAGVTSAIPLHGVDFVRRVQRSDGPKMPANVRMVGPGYFDVMRIPLLSGRLFTDADAMDSEPVALVSQSLAAAVYPGTNALGRDLLGTDARIVGIVADIRARSLAERPMPAFYLPRAQATSYTVCLLVRSRTGPRDLAADMRQVVGDVYPEQPISYFGSLAGIVADSVSDRRAYAIVAGVLALAMLLLSGLGLAGHLSHVVAERARDLAIRSALGASARQQRHVLVRHIVPALVAGIAVAVAAAYLLFPVLAPFTFEVGRFDAVSCGVSALLILVFAAAAVILPARRMARLDAAATLKGI